jgi:D-alanyl-lipoteichoic acid acyltransferase DltB (MBOAT superfamily)
MLFNSFAFAVFLPLVFALYWGVFNKKVRLRNLFLLAASYVFYGWWDWRFLSLIAVSSAIDFWVGKKIGALNELPSQNPSTARDVQQRKKRWLMLSLLSNLGILGFFKYCNFFVDSFIALFAALGIDLQPLTLHIILPVGISFYTFQTLSYTLDVYRAKLSPTKDVVQFFAFVSFFPQLVAGPIERAANLLPQFEKRYKPSYDTIRSAMLQIAWGLFKKIMIADRLAVFVDAVFGNVAAADGAPMLLGAVFFAFQLYLDFSAYSDIAIGTARLFGFQLCQNFRRPYLSASFGDFWKRWHISLSSWFQDYLYIPLGGNRCGNFRTKINVLVVFAVSGLWHGASWNFVIWGTVNALFLVLLDPILAVAKRDIVPLRAAKSVFIFGCWAMSLICFRAQGFHHALDGFSHLGLANIGSLASFGLNAAELMLSLALIGILLIKEIVWEHNAQLIPSKFFAAPALLRWAFYVALVLSMVFFGQYGGDNENAFIYFQF